MIVLDAINPETILAILNRLGVSKRCLQLNKAPSIEDEIARRLRDYVDEWLRTAVDIRGVESPVERNLNKTTAARSAVSEYVKKYGPMVVLDEKVGLAIAIARPEALPPEWEARRYFIHILMSNFRGSLGKCPHCKQYFVREPTRQRNKNGFFCSSAHNRIQAAIKATQQRRARVELQLVKRAAAQLHRRGQWTPAWSRRKLIKDWLSADLKKYLQKSHDQDLIAYRKSVRLSVHWVTRHQEDIEQGRQALKRPNRRRRDSWEDVLWRDELR